MISIIGQFTCIFYKIGEGEDTTNEYDTKTISLAHALSGPGI